MSKITNDIPPEALLKWIVKERDKYKAKLDMLVPYTKSLEDRVRFLEKARTADNESLMKQLSNAKARIAHLTQEKSELIEDYHKTEWYGQIQESCSRKNKRIVALQQTISRLMIELNSKEGEKQDEGK